jgi:hypothetical protein
MSGGAIFQEALRVVARQAIPKVAKRDLVACLEAVRPGPLQILYDAGAEANLSINDILQRGSAIYFNFCAGHLSDDLSDAECTYLDEPNRIGPCTQLILQNLFFLRLSESGLPPEAAAQVAVELINAVGPQHIELRTKHWSSEVFREVAEGIAGRQWSAYLQILWFGTSWASQAETIGLHAGIAAHVAKDISSGDPRYFSLSESDRKEVVAWGAARAAALQAHGLQCFQALLATVIPILHSVG